MNTREVLSSFFFFFHMLQLLPLQVLEKIDRERQNAKIDPELQQWIESHDFDKEIVQKFKDT